MGNTNSICQLNNFSKRNVRVFVTEKALEIDAFITSQAVKDQVLSGPPGGKKFIFRKDIDYIRVLASQTREVCRVPDRFLSMFVEDEDDENMCSKQIMHNMALSVSMTVLLYDV